MRLGLSQTDFASLAGASKGAQVKWEKDDASPNAQALIAFAEAGADVMYILSGKRQAEPFDMRAEANIQETLDRLEETIDIPRHEADRSGITMEEVVEGCRQALVKIATSTSPDITDVARARADEILRMKFNDPAAAKRRSARFAEIMLSRQNASKDLEDALTSLAMALPRSLHHQLLMLVTDYQVSIRDALPLLAEIKIILDDLQAAQQRADLLESNHLDKRG